MPMPAPLEDRLRACLAKHPDWTDDRIARAIIGAKIEVVRALRAGEPMPMNGADPPAPPAEGPEAGTITLTQVRNRYDTAAAIRAYLAGLKRGVLKLEREVSKETAGKDAARFRRTVENNMDEFRAFRVKLKIDQDQPDGSWFWGNKETVAEAVKLRDEV